ncbi:VLRF1 family aeRF1-type release factor [Bacillus sp. SG-1]|uniref:VLRF1 family aeRF1-type release factor n=1 Tax=Bacillus sp. SG-1 TaxID=161544 RepID=UPI00032011D7|nr:VLRF1 family aeRF1-type release factor [Bacillus sp. SG-1]
MNIRHTLNKLENLHLQKPDKLLTMYLNTDRRDPDQQGGKWKIALKNGFNSFEEYLEISNEEERKRFHSIREKVESHVASLERDLPRSIVVFASKDSGIWETLELQVPVQTNFYWEEFAVVDQLKEIHSQHPLTGVILVQQNQVKLIETALGQVEDTEMYHFDLDTEEWRRHAGPQPADINIGGNGGSANQDDHYKERIEAHQKRWYKSLGNKLDREAAGRKWEKIIVVGDKGAGHLLSENMNKEVDDVLQKNLLNQKEEKVLEEVFS